LRILESEKKTAREELREKEATTQTLQSKLTQAQGQLQRAEQEQIESRARLHEQDTARQNAEREAAELRSKFDELTKELAIEREKHAADSQALLTRIDVEKARAADALANRLAQKLRVEWRDFESVSSRPMDSEVGESLRHLLRGIFEMLEREGLKIRD
jgi:chromosome segregation ATPase